MYTVNDLITASSLILATPPLKNNTNTCENCHFMYVIAWLRLQ